MADQPTDKKRIVKTGYNDRLYNLSLSQGNVGGYLSDPYTWGGLPSVLAGTILPRRDDILIEEGGGGPRAIESYTRLFNDSAVISAWEKLVGEIIQRKWEVFPASDSDKDEEIAEFVRQTIYHLGTNTRQTRGRDMLATSNSGFDSFVRGMCESLILGISIGEICWMRQGGYVVPAEIKIRDPRRFQFVLNEDGSISPRVITIQSPVEGLPIPMRSMVIHRHWAYSNNMDPYGTGLGRQLYSLVEFRRTLMSFWLQYADKHTTPTAVGKFSLGTPEEEVKSLFTALQRLGQETAIVIPDEMDVDWLSGGEGRPEMYENIISYIDRQISFLINGESTVGQDTGSVGSYARDNVADSVRMRKAKAFSEQIDETLNATLVRWIVELNYPGSSVPRLRRNFEDLEQREDPVKVVQIMSQLQALGYQISDLDWVRDKLEIPSLEKGEVPGMDGMMPGMSESQPGAFPKGIVHQKKDEPEPLVMGEKTLGQLVSRNNYVSADNLDFSEFDESGDLKDKTVRDKVSKKIAERFNQGGLDEVGWERISTGISGLDSETSKLNIDEHTTPGDIVFTTKRLLEEVRNIPGVGSNEHYGTANHYRIEMTTYEQKIMREEEFSQDEINTLIGIYSKSYRLNRAVLHRECVVLDPEKTGYWSSFAPYFM
jgi:phage gp29-like protein